jgi:SAM-dependent methyltransferase
MKHQGSLIAERKAIKANGEEFMAKVINCQTCGYAHLDPLPTIDELGQFYAYHFYEKQKPDYLEKMERESSYWLEIYKWRFEIFQKHLGKKNPQLLDVGSSGGFFLAAAQKQGALVTGIEPSDKAAAYSKEKFNVDVQVSIYEKCTLPSASYDIVHSSLVIEHLLDPGHFIQWSVDMLKPGGLFIVETPHEFNEFQNLLTRKMDYPSWYIAYPDHLNYFDQPSLKSLAEKYGLKHKAGLCTFPIEQFIIEGLDYIKDGSLGLKAHQQRMAFEANLLKHGKGELLEKLYEAWSKMNIGRTQIGIFEKI